MEPFACSSRSFDEPHMTFGRGTKPSEATRLISDWPSDIRDQLTGAIMSGPQAVSRLCQDVRPDDPTRSDRYSILRHCLRLFFLADDFLAFGFDSPVDFVDASPPDAPFDAPLDELFDELLVEPPCDLPLPSVVSKPSIAPTSGRPDGRTRLESAFRCTPLDRPPAAPPARLRSPVAPPLALPPPDFPPDPPAFS